MSNTITKQLNWFQKHEVFLTVMVNYIITIPDVGVFGKDETLLEQELTDIAHNAGKTTWDEDDICTRLGLTRGN